MTDEHREMPKPVHDRALLLHGARRNEVLTLAEVEQYGLDCFGDRDYVSIYGMPPREWYRRGIRLLGRTAVECTRDALADRIGRDIAAIARLSPTGSFLAVDPFAGSCNTLYWVLRHLPECEGLAFELDPQVFDLSRRNIANLDRAIELVQGDYASLLAHRSIPAGRPLILFLAPPWGTALDETQGLDLRRTTPPIAAIIGSMARQYSAHPLLFATQVYEKVSADSLAEVRALLEWTDLRVYDLNAEGRNHGILLATKGWTPSPAALTRP
jgi:hypothetical protein